MSKFHKTSYSRPQSFQVVTSSQGRRSSISGQASGWITSQADELPLRSKLEVESPIVVIDRSSLRQTVRPIETHPARRPTPTEGKLYETSGGFLHPRERPMSKQEPRTRHQPPSHNVLTNERPQTSKGLRDCRDISSGLPERNKCESEEQFCFPVKITQKNPRAVQSSFSKRNTQEKVLAFETSIDPEFLSLFAN